MAEESPGPMAPDANITSGKLFRRVHKIGKAWGEGLTEKAVWHVVREYAAKAGIDKLAPHDLRRACARLCQAAGGELEQIQFLLGHVSIQITERYLGCKQRIRGAGNDKIGMSLRTEGRSVRIADNPAGSLLATRRSQCERYDTNYGGIV